MSLKETLLMPHTDFEMRGNLAKKEPIQIEKWQQMHLYEQMRAKNKGHETFHLHDGPPYANGDKVLFVVRTKSYKSCRLLMSR